MTSRQTTGVTYGAPKLSASRASLLFGTALGVSIAIFAASPNQAWAADECGADVGGVAVCTSGGNPYPTGIDYTADAGEDITVILLGGGLAVGVVTPTDDGVTATGVANYNATIEAYAGSSVSAVNDGLEVDAYGSGTATVISAATILAGDSGIDAFSTGVGGDVVVDNTGSITADGTSANNFTNGILAIAGDTITITNSGDLTVTSAGGDVLAAGIYAYALSDSTVSVTSTGADIYVNNGTVINTGVFNAVGIYAGGGYFGAAAIADDVTVTGSGSITVYGNGDAAGIATYANNGSVVDWTGDIAVTSYGGTVSGVTATTSSATGYVDITIAGDIYTDADGAVYANNYGITAVASSSPAGTVDIDVLGDITVEDGNYGIGIYAAGGGAITIDVDGAITVDGTVAYAWGVYAINTGGSTIDINVGDITVNQTGALAGGAGIIDYTVGASTIVAEDITTAGNYTDGIRAGGNLGIGGDTTIDVASVTTSGDGAQGIVVGAQGFVDVGVTGAVTTTGYAAVGLNLTSSLETVVANVGSVSTLGDEADAILAYGYADVTVTATGAISTAGANSTGVVADSSDGATVINVTSVTTAGSLSYGVEAYGYDSATVTATGTVSTTGFGAGGVYVDAYNGDATANVAGVTTTGDFADAVNVYSYNGDAIINGAGTVSTAGPGSDGLDAFAYNGDAVIDNTGDVTTTGDGSSALEAGSYNGSVTITNSGDLNTTGAGSAGIYGYTISLGSGDVDITNTGVITTTGDGSYGINANAYDGIATVDHTGTINTSGLGSTGIYAYGYAGVNITNADTTVITSGDSAVGIFGFSPDGYVLINSGTVTTTGDASDGIVGVSLGSDLATDYVTINSGTVSTDGLASDGIIAYTYNGQITIDSGTVTTLGDDSYGIFAYANNDGSISIESDYVDTSGVNSFGIYAYAFLGTSTVDSFDVDTDGDNSIGIYNYGFTGAYVESTFVQTDGAFSGGIVNLAYYGLATVGSFSVLTNGDDSTGIFSLGSAGSDVESSFVATYGDRSDGIVSVSTGGNLSSVISYSVYTAGDYSDGIVAVGQGYYDSGVAQAYAGSVYVDSAFVETRGYNAYGIYAAAGGGDVDVNSNIVRTYGDFSTGIYAAAFNYYDSGLLLNLQGDVYVDSEQVYTSGIGSTGIDAYAEGGNIEIFSNQVVTNGDSSVGIQAYAAYYLDPVLLTYYSGDVYISATSTTTFGDFSDGINAYAGGGDVLIRASLVRAYGLDADAIYAGTGGLDASNSDNVAVYTYNTIYSFDGVGIAVNSAGASDIYVESGSVYGYDWGIQSASVDGTYIYNDGAVYGGEGRAIDVDGGAATIFNYGYIAGFIDLTDNDDYVYNDGVWEAYGVSVFGLGSDRVVNTGTVGFSRYQGAASTTTFAGLEFFDNYGLVTGVDGQAGDSLNISGNFFGGAGSQLALDVQLGGPGSIADTLVIGSASGVTEILPSDTLSATPGALNFGGILVVDSANAAETGTEFVMDNVDKGFVEYSLLFDAANDNWLIVGLPDDEVFELLGAMSSSQDFWRRSADAVSARWQEVRDASPTGSAQAGPGGMGRSDGWELWMQAHGGEESFDNFATFSLGGFTFAQDITASSDWRGFQFGFDNLQGEMLWGLTMGFTQQETKFDVDGNSFDTEGWNIGAYAGWSSGGFFLNGLVKGDFFEQDANFHTLPSIFTFDGVTWGAEAEVGYRWEGESVFFEPIASLQWSTTNLDSTTTAGASIDFDDAESLRGKAGARIGGTWGTGDVVWTPYIGAYWVDEFQGDNSMAFTTGVTTIEFSDQGRGSYGQADLGVTFQTFYGLEGFVKGEWNFGGDADGGAARLGARWRW